MVENTSANAVDAKEVIWILGSESSPGVGNGNPSQYSFQGNPMNRGTWWLSSMEAQRVKHDRVTEYTHTLIAA